jgi:DNA polymerase III alpha subunit
MRLDKFNNPIFNNADIFNALYEGHVAVLSELIVDRCAEINQLSEIAEVTFKDVDTTLDTYSNTEYDTHHQSNWFMPTEYYDLDIRAYCMSKCTTNDECVRVSEELAEFEKRNMIHLLQWLKYFVDTCLENNIVWGLGRGSSVASYVLYLIGTHKINSIKYNLDWQEFLR